MNLEQKNPKNPHIRCCNICHYYTSSNKDYIKHIATRKHQIREKSNKIEPNRTENPEKSQSGYNCEICNKSYLSRSGLWNHKKKCSQQFSENTLLENSLTETDIANPSILINILKDNQEFKSLLIEQHKIQLEQQKENRELQNKLLEMAKNQNQTVTNTNTNCNNTNNQFNLNFFLNETCKDAINMVEFVKSIQLHLEDLEETARVGYVEGVSRIFVKALNDMEVNKRPIHCTDIKRETVYVKNNDNWEKDNPEKKNLKNAVDYIANKNMQQINDWKEENPSWQDIKSEESQVLNKLYMTTMGGGTEEEDKKYMNKIIKNILHEVVVEKEQI